VETGAKQTLAANGIVFPERATARWNPLSKRLVVRDTQENLDDLEFLLLRTQNAVDDTATSARLR
jgi:hypothetical protein